MLKNPVSETDWSWIYEELIRPYERRLKKIKDELKHIRRESHKEEMPGLDDFDNVLKLYENVRNIILRTSEAGSFYVKEHMPTRSVITLYPYSIERDSASNEENTARKIGVFIHELFHAMHYYYFLADKQCVADGDKMVLKHWTKDTRVGIKRDAVIESLADSFACALCSELGIYDKRFNVFVQETQASWDKHAFPFWPYSGAKVLFNNKNNNKFEIDLFMRALDLSKTSWSQAFSLIEEKYFC